MLCLRHATLFTPGEIISDGDLLIVDHLVGSSEILAVGKRDAFPIPVQARQVDLGGMMILPGFIDIQINGAFGKDFTENPDSLWQVAAGLPRFGVTSFLPTVITSPLATIQHALEVWSEGPPAGFRGAIPLGYHLEGPMLNPGKKGAHNPDHMRLPMLELVAGWSPVNGVRLVTLAPELPGAAEVIRSLVRQGVVVSAGHSLASYEQALQAVEQGVTCGTHLFNAMPPLDHRAPGLTAALLNLPDLHTGIIADGIHVHPAMLELAWKAKSPRSLILVSDAMAALGMPPGRYRLGNFDVTVDETSARLPDGTLAGSILAMDAAVRNWTAFTGCTLAEAAACASANPAGLLGLITKGRIRPGRDADLVVLDSSLEVAATLVGGEVVYSTLEILNEAK
jgi:N-acetylglucosamine-6-phosphate deacetylase